MCEAKAKYYYRIFGELFMGMESTDKVTETFTGKELDDETSLNYFGARYLDPMLGLWISVDNARQFDNPYTYAGNNPVIVHDPDGNVGVVGGLLNVATSYVEGYIGACLFGEEFNYTLADAAVDFTMGCIGAGPLEKGAKAVKLYKQANVIRKTKPITYKKSGAVATKHKWANKAEGLEKEARGELLDIAKDKLSPIEN